MGSHYLVEPETIPARYTPQGRAEAPEALRGRIQLPAQPPHHGTNHAAQANPCLSGNPNHHLQTTCRHAGAKLIFIFVNFTNYSLISTYGRGWVGKGAPGEGGGGGTVGYPGIALGNWSGRGVAYRHYPPPGLNYLQCVTNTSESW